MSLELVIGGVIALLALVGGAAGWIRSDQHGRTSAKLDQALKERDELREQAEASSIPPASPPEASRILRVRLARAARRLRRVRAGRE